MSRPKRQRDHDENQTAFSGFAGHRVGIVGSICGPGSYVDENGVLQEPFYLLALGWLFVLAGGAMLLGVVGVKMIEHFRSPK